MVFIVFVLQTSSPDNSDTDAVVAGSGNDGCTNGAYYPNPGICNSFFICVNGMLVKQKCAHGLVWNQDRTMCDWMFNVKCAEDSSEYARTQTNLTATSIATVFRHPGGKERDKNTPKILTCMFLRYSCSSASLILCMRMGVTWIPT